MYIVFEGVIGTGKTAQSKKYADYLKKKYPKKLIVWTREPGGSEVADSIRKVAQAQKYEEKMNDICEIYLYAASRAQTLRHVVAPVLKKGGIVVADRSFISALANQAFGRKLGLDLVMTINKEAVDGIIPDKIVYMDLPIKTGMQRAFDKKGDKFESLGESFYRRVALGYKKIQKMKMFKSKWVNINAKLSQEAVFDQIVAALKL